MIGSALPRWPALPHIEGMIRHAAIVALLLSAAPLAAEEEAPNSLIEDGARMFLRGLMQEMEPALKSLEDLADQMEPALRDFAQTMGPALRQLMDEVEDWSVYEPPVMLPNGDIILRRKVPLKPEPETVPDDGGTEIEL